MPVGVAAVALAAGVWIGRNGLPWLGLEPLRGQLAQLRADNAQAKAELGRLRAPAAMDSGALMERSTVAALGEQVERLEADNAKLKEDVAFFEAATADRPGAAAAGGAIAIRRFQVVPDAATHAARYRVLLTQDSKANRDFAGELRLTVTIQRAGKAVSIDFPGSRTPAVPDPLEAEGVHIDGDPAQFQVVFRSYKRIDGSFRFPADTALRAVEIRIVERNSVIARQTVSLG